MQGEALANDSFGLDISNLKEIHMRAHPTHAIVNLEALRQNLSSVRAIVGPRVGVMAVVKSNGYGHGALAVAREAVSAGASYLAVARIDEGVELRKGGIETPILAFEIAADWQLPKALDHSLDLTVASFRGAAAINEVAGTAGRRPKVHVKVDTGMGRLGMNTREAAGVIERIAHLDNVEVAAVWSHFATADEEDQTYARKQLARFHEVLDDIGRKGIPVPLRHMANSAGILTLPESHFDMVRPGIMLYGVPPRKNMTIRHPLSPVMSVVSFVAFLKEVDAGSGISYGKTFVTRTRTRIATVPIGYADGYFRGLSNRSHVLIRGTRYPVVGTVSMDQIMVEVGMDSNVRENDIVTLIGRDGKEEITAHELADILGTIPYEIMCAVSSRVARVLAQD